MAETASLQRPLFYKAQSINDGEDEKTDVDGKREGIPEKDYGK